MLYSMYHYFPYAFVATCGVTLLVCQVVDEIKRGKTKPRR